MTIKVVDKSIDNVIRVVYIISMSTTINEGNEMQTIDYTPTLVAQKRVDGLIFKWSKRGIDNSIRVYYPDGGFAFEAYHSLIEEDARNKWEEIQ